MPTNVNPTKNTSTLFKPSQGGRALYEIIPYYLDLVSSVYRGHPHLPLRNLYRISPYKDNTHEITNPQIHIAGY